MLLKGNVRARFNYWWTKTITWELLCTAQLQRLPNAHSIGLWSHTHNFPIMRAMSRSQNYVFMSIGLIWLASKYVCKTNISLCKTNKTYLCVLCKTNQIYLCVLCKTNQSLCVFCKTNKSKICYKQLISVMKKTIFSHVSCLCHRRNVHSVIKNCPITHRHKFLKMLCLYRLDQNCLHLTFEPYLSSETYFRKYKKLPNIIIHARKDMTEKWNCWKCLARKFGFVYLRFDPLRGNSEVVC